MPPISRAIDNIAIPTPARISVMTFHLYNQEIIDNDLFIIVYPSLLCDSFFPYRRMLVTDKSFASNPVSARPCPRPMNPALNSAKEVSIIQIRKQVG